MKLKRTIISAAVLSASAFASLALAPNANAHGIWFAERAKNLSLIYGVGADDLDSVKRLDKITSVAGYDENMAPVATTLRANGPLLVVDSEEPVRVVAAAMDYGVWTKTPDGEWHAAGLDKFPNGIVSEHNYKYAVHINGSLASPVPLIAGHKLQIIPVTNPIPAEMHQPLTVRVIYDGKPMANVAVINDYVNDPDQKPLMTNAEGLAIVPIRNQGLNVLMAVYIAPSDDPARYKQMEYRSSLTFVLPHAPE